MKIRKKIIIGAGLAGLTAATFKRDIPTDVYEKNSVVGGLCINWDSDTRAFVANYRSEFEALSYSPCRYGGHTFHTNNEKCYKIFNEIYDTEVYELRTIAVTGGMAVEWPINRYSLLKFGFTEQEISELKEKFPDGSTFDALRYFKQDKEFTDKCENMYNQLIVPYSKKQWGDNHDYTETVRRRVKVFYDNCNLTFRDKYQCVPVRMNYGYTKLLNDSNVRFIFNQIANVKSLIDAQDHIKDCLIINTSPIDRFYNLESKLPYRTCDFEYGYDHNDDYKDLPGVINTPDEMYGYTRIHKHDKILSYEVPRDVVDDNDVPMYPFEDVNLFKYLQQNYPDNNLRVMPLSNGTNVLLDLDTVPGSVILHTGRLATYTYMNMDTTIEQTFLALEKLDTLDLDDMFDCATVSEYAWRSLPVMIGIDDNYAFFRADPTHYVKMISHPHPTEDEIKTLKDESEYYEEYKELIKNNKLSPILLPLKYSTVTEEGTMNLGFYDVENHQRLLSASKETIGEVMYSLSKIYKKYVKSNTTDKEVEILEEFSNFEPLKKASFYHGNLKLENIFYRKLHNGTFSIQIRNPKGSTCTGSLLADMIMFYKSCVEHNYEHIAENFIAALLLESIGIEDTNKVIEKIKHS